MPAFMSLRRTVFLCESSAIWVSISVACACSLLASFNCVSKNTLSSILFERNKDNGFCGVEDASPLTEDREVPVDALLSSALLD